MPVKGAPQALAVKHGMAPHRLGQAPICIDIGEIKLTTRFKQALHTLQHRGLVGGEVEHTIGDDHIEAFRFQVQICELLDGAIQEGDIGVTELLGMEFRILTGNGKLFSRHVDADDGAPGPDKLGQKVGIAARTTAQIKDAAAGELVWADQAAAVITASYIWMHFGQQGPQPGRHSVGIAAGSGLEISAAAQFFAVIGLHGGLQGHRLSLGCGDSFSIILGHWGSFAFNLQLCR